MHNTELINLFSHNLDNILELLTECNLIEVTQMTIVGHK
jgi:hypothetical protein